LNSQTTTIYSGLFDLFDSQTNIDNLNTQQSEAEKDIQSAEKSQVLLDQYSQNTAIAYVRRQDTTVVSSTSSTSSSSNRISDSSTPATTKINGITYTITSDSSLNVDGFEWTSLQIKTVLELQTLPITLIIKTDSLYSSDKFLDTLTQLSQKLITKYLTTTDLKVNYAQVQQNFKNTNS
jgi:hypothetical protein